MLKICNPILQVKIGVYCSLFLSLEYGIVYEFENPPHRPPPPSRTLRRVARAAHARRSQHAPHGTSGGQTEEAAAVEPLVLVPVQTRRMQRPQY